MSSFVISWRPWVEVSEVDPQGVYIYTQGSAETPESSLSKEEAYLPGDSDFPLLFIPLSSSKENNGFEYEQRQTWFQGLQIVSHLSHLVLPLGDSWVQGVAECPYISHSSLALGPAN